MEAVGIDAFHSVVHVSLNYSDDSGVREDNDNPSDAALAHVGRLPNVRTLLLSDTQATDASLVHLKNLSKLQCLYMWDASAVTDTGVEQLRNLKQLEQIHISGSGITDESMKLFASLPNIRKLSLQNNRFSNDALKYAGKAMRLETLVVGSVSRTVARSGDVYGLGDPSQCTIDDDGLAYISGLANLAHLGVQGSKIQGSGFRHLDGLKNLKTIWIGVPPQPHAGELIAKIPGLTIQ